jgi:hypothetical protein
VTPAFGFGELSGAVLLIIALRAQGPSLPFDFTPPITAFEGRQGKLASSGQGGSANRVWCSVAHVSLVEACGVVFILVENVFLCHILRLKWYAEMITI